MLRQRRWNTSGMKTEIDALCSTKAARDGVLFHGRRSGPLFLFDRPAVNNHEYRLVGSSGQRARHSANPISAAAAALPLNLLIRVVLG
jgi:hypothetical protein